MTSYICFFQPFLFATSSLVWSLWATSALASLLLVVLLIWKWKSLESIHKCALFSLLAHLMIACWSMTVPLVWKQGENGTSEEDPLAVVWFEETDLTQPEQMADQEDVLLTPKKETEVKLEPAPKQEQKNQAEEKPIQETDSQKNNVVPDSVENPTANPAVESAAKTTGEVSDKGEMETATEALSHAVATEQKSGPLEALEAKPKTELASKDDFSTDASAEFSTDFSKELPTEFAPERATELPTDLFAELPIGLPVELPTELPTEPPIESAAEPTDFSPAKQLRSLTNLTPVQQPVLEKTAQVLDRYQQRFQEERIRTVRANGGSIETEKAVVAALTWLASVQSRDGRWDSDKLGAGRENHVLGHNRNRAGSKADTGITGLTLLAFLGAGQTHTTGEYQKVVEKGLRFLIHQQAADGNLYGDATFYAQTYCHSMATFALAEAYAITKDPDLRVAVTKAIEFSMRGQSRRTGSWRYRPGDSGDTSQLGWQMMALQSAQLAGLEVSAQTWRRTERYLALVRRGTHHGLASYRPDSAASRTMTAEAMYCRQLLATQKKRKMDFYASQEASNFIRKKLPNLAKPNLYYWYYGTLALYHRKDFSEATKKEWEQWNASLTRTLTSSQERKGPLAGSWAPSTVWGGYGGRAYSTAMAAMCLEVYYRYGTNEAVQAPFVADHFEFGTQRR